MTTLGNGRTVVVENETVFAIVEYRTTPEGPTPPELYRIMEVAENQKVFTDWEDLVQLEGGPDGERYYVANVGWDFEDFPEFKNMTHEEAKVEIHQRLSKVLDGIEVRFVGSE